MSNETQKLAATETQPLPRVPYLPGFVTQELNVAGVARDFIDRLIEKERAVGSQFFEVDDKLFILAPEDDNCLIRQAERHAQRLRKEMTQYALLEVNFNRPISGMALENVRRVLRGLASNMRSDNGSSVLDARADANGFSCWIRSEDAHYRSFASTSALSRSAGRTISPDDALAHIIKGQVAAAIGSAAGAPWQGPSTGGGRNV